MVISEGILGGIREGISEQTLEEIIKWCSKGSPTGALDGTAGGVLEFSWKISGGTTAQVTMKAE